MLEEMLNYFPDTDERVRSLKYSLDAQLLNPMALGMEGHQRRVTREVRARSFAAPLNLDNRGVYYKCYVPPSLNLAITPDGRATPPQTVIGQLPGLSEYVTLQPYDDTLPVPTRIEFDSSLGPVPLSSPLIFAADGTDYPQTLTPGPLAFPNRVSLVLSGLPDAAGAVEVTLRGAPWPSPLLGNPAPTVEVLLMRDEGVAVSQTAYASVDSVTVRGLPSGATLQGYLFLATGIVPDADRPAVDKDWRGFRFPRYWQLDGALLKDTYTRGRFTGFQIAESYLCSSPLTAIAVEPNTAGLWVASGTSLCYMDRRAQQPTGLSNTAITTEPLYGLDVRYDESYPGSVRWVRITPDGYAGAANTVRYRYLITIPGTPLAGTWLLTPEGALAPYTPYGGWRAGTPGGISMPLTATGTYLFTLECSDATNTITSDTCPYLNAAFTPHGAFDLSALVPSIAGLCFDALQRLWVWTGNYLVPLRLHYDAYLFDPSARILYLTDAYDNLYLW
jgi:hypothetical protein